MTLPQITTNAASSTATVSLPTAIITELESQLALNLADPLCAVAHKTVSLLLQPNFKPQETYWAQLNKELDAMNALNLHPDNPLKKAKDAAQAAIAAAGITLPAMQHNVPLYWFLERHGAEQLAELKLKCEKNDAGVYLVRNNEGKLLFEVRKDNTFIMHDTSDEAIEKTLQLFLKAASPGQKVIAKLFGFSPEFEQRFLAIATRLGVKVEGQHVSTPVEHEQDQVKKSATAPEPTFSSGKSKEEEEEEKTSNYKTPTPLKIG